MIRPNYLLLAAICLMACNQPAKRAETTKQPTTTTDSSTTANQHDAVPANKLIVAGKSIGQTALNDNGAEVTKRLGRPDAGDAAMGKSLSVWYANHDTSGYQTMVYAHRAKWEPMMKPAG